MKKFLSVMLLTVGIIFGTQLAAVKTAHAELVYAFSYNGLDYYIDTESSEWSSKFFSTYPKCFLGSTRVNGYIQRIDLASGFDAAEWVCVFYLADGKGLVVAADDLSTSTSVWIDFAMSVINIYQNNLAKIQAQIEQHNREVEAQKRREAEAREREKQRLAEQKRREDEARKRREEEQKRREAEARKNKFDSLIAAGDQAYSAQNFSAAIESYESARKLDSSSVDKFVKELVKNGDKLRSQRNYPAALDYYKKALVMNPDGYSAEQKLQDTYYSLKNFSDAANFYQTMTTIRLNNSHHWLMLGSMLNELKDYDGAIAAYTRSAELFPENEFDYKNRGVAYKNLGRYDEAIAAYKKALELKPNFKDALDELWDAYCKSGKFDDAADFYNKRVTTQIDYSDSWFRLAWSLNEQKKFPEAIKAMHSFIDCFPPDSSSANGWYWIARVYQNAGDTKKAVDACKTALNFDPKHDDAKKLLAQLSGGK